MRIGAVLAMEEEMSVLLRFSTFHKTTFRDYDVYEGKLGDHSVFVLRLAIGKVQAAHMTTLFLEHYRLDAIVNVGIAGGLQAELGDVILARGALYHDVDVTAFGDYEPGQLPGFETVFASDAGLLEKGKQALEKANMPFKTGLLCSGDSFAVDMTPFAPFMKRYDDLLGVDMESAPVGHVAFLMGVPFLAIRGISDCIGKADQLDDHEARAERACYRAAEAFVEVVKAL